MRITVDLVKHVAIRIKKILLSPNLLSVSVFSLLLIVLSFMIHLKSLGYYLDDLPELHALVVRGITGIRTNFLYDDRPLAWWPFYALFKLLGTNAVGWHIVNNLLRWIVGLELWFLFSLIWGKNRREVFWTVLLFSVYPIFTQQSMALSYIPHWVCYLFYVLSMLLMVLGLKSSRGSIKWILFFLSLLSSAVNLFTYEYFIGVEFARPIIIWLILRQDDKWKKIKTTVFIFLPYFILDLFYIFWRVFLVKNYRGVDPILFSQLANEPIQTAIFLVRDVLRDTIYVIISNWFSTLNIYLIDFSSRNFIFGLFLALIILIILVPFIILNKKNNEIKHNFNKFFPSAMILGFIGVLLGCLPAWVVQSTISNPNTYVFDRMAIPAIWGASLFCVAMIFYIVDEKFWRGEVFLIILICLAVMRNFTVTEEFRWSSIWNNRLLSQIKWRIPYLKPNTLILADSEYIKYIPPFAMSFQFNLLYPSSNQSPYIDYYFLTINKYFSKNSSDIKNGIPVNQQHLYAKFRGITTDSIVIWWNKTATDCVWILSENDKNNPLISENTRIALPASNYSRIITSETDFIPDKNIFGQEDRNTWCYYYEAADLARQQGDWANVTSLYEQARNAGYSPANGVELIPFIEAYARSGQANVAADLTVVAKSLTPLMRDYTCDTWNRVAKDVQNDPLFDAEYKAYSEQDLCWEVK